MSSRTKGASLKLPVTTILKMDTRLAKWSCLASRKPSTALSWYSPHRLADARSGIFSYPFPRRFHEEVPLHRQPDHRRAQAGRGRYARAGVVPRARDRKRVE